MSNSKKLVYTGFEIVDIAALVKGASTGEGLGNRFLGSLRDCDAILYVLRAFEDPSVPGDTDPRADLDTLELELVLADLASVEGRLVPPAAGGEGRQVARRRDRRARARGQRSWATARRSTAPTSPTTSASCSRPRSCSPTSRCSPSSTSARTSSTGSTSWSRRSPTASRRSGVCLQLEAEAAQLEPDERAELLEGLGLGEGVVPRVAARRVPPARPAHVPHHGRHRVAGVDVPRRRQGARVRGRDPLRPAARLHPRRGDLLAASCSTSARGRRPRSRASCASRGRTTRSSTATCSRSGSTCDEARRWPGSCATVRCWPRSRWPRPRRARRRGLLGRDGFDGALVLRPCRHVHTVGHAVRRSTSRSATRDGVVLRTCDACAPWRVSPLVRAAPRSSIEAEAGRVRPLAAAGSATGVELRA